MRLIQPCSANAAFNSAHNRTARLCWSTDNFDQRIGSNFQPPTWLFNLSPKLNRPLWGVRPNLQVPGGTVEDESHTAWSWGIKFQKIGFHEQKQLRMGQVKGRYTLHPRISSSLDGSFEMCGFPSSNMEQSIQPCWASSISATSSQHEALLYPCCPPSVNTKTKKIIAVTYTNNQKSNDRKAMKIFFS